MTKPRGRPSDVPLDVRIYRLFIGVAVFLVWVFIPVAGYRWVQSNTEVLYSYMDRGKSTLNRWSDSIWRLWDSPPAPPSPQQTAAVKTPPPVPQPAPPQPAPPQAARGQARIASPPAQLKPDRRLEPAPAEERPDPSPVPVVLLPPPPPPPPEPAPLPAVSAVVRTMPPQAIVTLDGASLGRSPVTIKLRDDGSSHKLTLSLPGYRTLEYPFDSPLKLPNSFTLTRSVGRIRVTPTAGYDAEVTVNGENWGRVLRGRPLERDLPVGTHRAAIVASDVYLNMQSSVVIADGQTLDLTLPQARQVRLIPVPGNGKVSIDGRPVEKLLPDNVLLTEGRHVFVFTWPGKVFRTEIEVTSRTEHVQGTIPR